MNVIFNTGASNIVGDVIDPSQTKLNVIDANNFNFSANQPYLSGTLRYDVSISSDAFSSLSPIAIWVVNVYNCN